jgi:hypothetical protein
MVVRSSYDPFMRPAFIVSSLNRLVVLWFDGFRLCMLFSQYLGLIKDASISRGLALPLHITPHPAPCFRDSIHVYAGTIDTTEVCLLLAVRAEELRHSSPSTRRYQQATILPHVVTLYVGVPFLGSCQV